jgi:branched-subunit amino acid transport protein
MNIWVVMLLGGLLTYTIRLSFILVLSKREVSNLLKRALRLVPPAVFSAIIIPELFMPSGKIEPMLINNRLVAGLTAVIVAWKTKNVVATILAGMAVLWLLEYFL